MSAFLNSSEAPAMTLYVVRHGESLGNERDIIQGADFDPGLTQRGCEQARQVGAELQQRVGDDAIVYTSPTRRTRETAGILGGELNAPVEVDELLVEFDPGILAGHAKRVLAERYPEFLDIWHARGDLDEIPGAETGDEVQARALVVLDRIIRSGGHTDVVIVAHAGFNRYLVNTARGQERTKPIGHEPTDWSVVRNASLVTSCGEVLSGGKASEVRRVQTRTSTYILKQTTGVEAHELAFQEWVSTFVNRKCPTFPDVLAWDVCDGTGLQALGELRGEHVYGSLELEARRQLCRTVAQFGELLQHTNKHFSLTNLHDRIEETVETTRSELVRTVGRRLLETDVLVDNGNARTFVHYDLHRGNILFDGTSVRILDLDAFCRAPPMFQPASLFMAGFMLEDVSGFRLDDCLDWWPSSLNRQRLSVFLLARAFIGLAFFERRRLENHMSESDSDIHRRYVEATERILDEYLGWSVPDGIDA